MENHDSELARLQHENKLLQEELNLLKSRTILKSSDYDIYEKSPTGIFIIGGNYIMEFVNDSFAGILGVSVEELQGKDFRDYISAEDVDTVVDRYKRRRQGENIPTHYEFRVNHPSGNLRFVEITSALIHDSEGNLKTIGQLIDITSKKKAEEALIKSEERYRTLVEKSPNGAILTDPEGKILTVNNKALQIHGYDSLEEMKHNVGAFFNLVDESDRETAMEVARAVCNREERESNYFLLLRKDGTTFPSEIIYTVILDPDSNQDNLLTIIRDITPRIKAEIALKESKAFLQSVFDGIQEGISVLDRNMNIMLTNSWMDSMYKDSIPLKGKKCYEVFHNRTEECHVCPTRQALKTKKTHTEIQVFEQNGVKKGWLEISAFPVQNDEGEVSNIIEYIKDITKSRNDEIRLKENEKFISAIADTSPALIYVFDLVNYKHIYVNKAVTQLLGYTPAEILNQETPQKVNFHLEEEQEKIAKHLERVKKDQRDNSYEIEVSLKHKNGEFRKFMSYERPFKRDEDGTVTHIIGVTIDITEQHKANTILTSTMNKLSNIMKAANDGMWDWHLDSDTMEFDPRYYEMAGYEYKDFPFHINEYWKRVHIDDYNNLKLRLEQHIEGITDRFNAEFRFRKKDGKWMWIMGRGITVEWDKEKKPVRIMGTHTDISELKKIQNDLIQAKIKAEESDRLKSAFLANMSHEIRTPMNGILGFADLLASDDLEKSEIKEYLEIIKSSGTRMLETINDIIDISKIEAGQTEIVLSEINLNDQISYMYNFFLPEAKKKGISLVFTKGLEDKDAKLLTDHQKLIGIFTNLLKNALKFTHNGNIKFGYTKRAHEILFYVSDTGIGIEPERQDAIFDRFVQADLTITKPYEGSGLGLSISKGFVNLLGGKIWLHSEPGTGTTFYFTLPDKTERSEGKFETEQDDIILNMTRLNETTVLVVDDDDSARFFLSEVLKKHCKKILHASTGKEAVDICRADQSIGLVLMDIKLPEIDGYEATRQIRKFNKDVVIIGQTAYALLGDKDKVLGAGCDDYIAKPIDKTELMRIIMKYI